MDDMRHFISPSLVALVLSLANASNGARGFYPFAKSGKKKPASDHKITGRPQRLPRGHQNRPAEKWRSVGGSSTAPRRAAELSPAPAQTGEGAQPEDTWANRHLSADAPCKNAATIPHRLIERIVQLPDRDSRGPSISCAPASRGKRCGPFGKTPVDCARAFLLSGSWSEVDGFGKRSARRFVTAKVQEAPSAYAEKIAVPVFSLFHGIIGVAGVGAGRLCPRALLVRPT